jgi:hypothetical protein
MAIKCDKVIAAMPQLGSLIDYLVYESVVEVLRHHSLQRIWTSIDSIKGIIGIQIKEGESQPVYFGNDTH